MFQFLQKAPTRIGISEPLTRLAERLTTLVLVTLVPEQIYVLVTVLTLEMIPAHLLDYMMLKTVFTAKHSAILWAKPSSVRHAFFVGTMTLWAHAGAIMPFLVFDAFFTNFAVVVAAEVSRHCGDEVVVVFA